MRVTASIPINLRYLKILRISIGIIYSWFGALKFFRGYSPAEDLAINTINKISFGLIPTPANILLLAVWESAVGLLLISGKATRTALVLLFVHMAFTFTPLMFFPAVSFQHLPYGFTLVGQYIMKNIVIVAAALVIWPGKHKDLVERRAWS